jgi:very-short-patch-repair endonuclease
MAKRSDLELTFEFQIKAAGIDAFELEYRFDGSEAKRRWRFDFAWPEPKVAVEIEGGTWAGGRHTRGTGFEEDARKYAEALVQGWKVLRVTRKMVEDLSALTYLEQVLACPGR